MFMDSLYTTQRGSASNYYGGSYGSGTSDFGSGTPMRSASMSQFNASTFSHTGRVATSSRLPAGTPYSTYSSMSRPMALPSYERSPYDYATYRSPYGSAGRRAEYLQSTTYTPSARLPPTPASSNIYAGRYTRSSNTTANQHAAAYTSNQSASSGYSSSSSSTSSRDYGNQHNGQQQTRTVPLIRSASVDRYGLNGGAGGLESEQRERLARRQMVDVETRMERMMHGGDGNQYSSSYGATRRNYRRTTDQAGSGGVPSILASPSDSDDFDDRIDLGGEIGMKNRDSSVMAGHMKQQSSSSTSNTDDVGPPPIPPLRTKSPGSSAGGAGSNKRVTFDDPTSKFATSSSNNGGNNSSTTTTNNYHHHKLASLSVRDHASVKTGSSGSNSTQTLHGILRSPSPSSPNINGESKTTTMHVSTSSPSIGQSTNVGVTGLVNIGNTCFMNSVLQCLSHTKPLRSYCLGFDSTEINSTTSRMKGALMKAFCELLTQLWREQRTAVTPDSFKTQVQKFAPRFTGYSQQDAQEFLRYLMQGLHEDINRVRAKPKPDHSELADTMADNVKASTSWKRYLRIDDSRVVDIFVGQLKSELRCTHCGHVSSTFDPFWDLSLPIPVDRYSSSKSVSIYDCFQSLTGEEVLDGDEQPTCDKCKTRRKCTKRFVIYKFPQILVLHLKRFSGERYRSRLSTLVNFPLRDLDLGKFATDACRNQYFDLYGVSNHSGTPLMGHYTAYVKHAQLNDKWYHFDDSRVSPIADANRTVVSSDAYVLFYELQNSHQISRL